VYIDMELRAADVNCIRSLFERVTSLHASSKKMKYFFSRYLTWAREQADDSLVDHVKEKARQYVESASAAE